MSRRLQPISSVDQPQYYRSAHVFFRSIFRNCRSKSGKHVLNFLNNIKKVFPCPIKSLNFLIMSRRLQSNNTTVQHTFSFAVVIGIVGKKFKFFNNVQEITGKNPNTIGRSNNTTVQHTFSIAVVIGIVGKKVDQKIVPLSNYELNFLNNHTFSFGGFRNCR
uniref:Uncharacterized protein n=1 Tax=Heterorhabditis bacteriophora TaxID=37862 RepID=A0A1I7WDM7_HETBA